MTVNFEFYKKIIKTKYKRKKNIIGGLNYIQVPIRSYTAHFLQG